jgi:hypothetical protein
MPDPGEVLTRNLTTSPRGADHICYQAPGVTVPPYYASALCRAGLRCIFRLDYWFMTVPVEAIFFWTWGARGFFCRIAGRLDVRSQIFQKSQEITQRDSVVASVT